MPKNRHVFYTCTLYVLQIPSALARTYIEVFRHMKRDIRAVDHVFFVVLAPVFEQIVAGDEVLGAEGTREDGRLVLVHQSHVNAL